MYSLCMTLSTSLLGPVKITKLDQFWWNSFFQITKIRYISWFSAHIYQITEIDSYIFFITKIGYISWFSAEVPPLQRDGYSCQFSIFYWCGLNILWPNSGKLWPNMEKSGLLSGQIWLLSVILGLFSVINTIFLIFDYSI